MRLGDLTVDILTNELKLHLFSNILSPADVGLNNGFQRLIICPFGITRLIRDMVWLAVVRIQNAGGLLWDVNIPNKELHRWASRK
jgi:hypothetical protein